MDPLTIQQLGELRQREILEQAQQERTGMQEHSWLHRMGSLLIMVGEKMVRAAQPQAVPASIATDIRSMSKDF